jgi:signal transduction histidine kinase
MNIPYISWVYALPIIVLSLCIGILTCGFLVMVYVSAVEKKWLYGTIALLSLLGLCFTGSEIAVILCGYSGNFSLGRQFHRIQALSAAVFIFALPFYLAYLLESTSALRRMNSWVIRISIFVVAGILAIAFIKPELFLGMGERAGASKPWSGGRATPGPVYVIRDCLIALIGLYSLFMLIVEFKQYRHKRHIILSLCGTAIAVLSGVVDVVIAQIERPMGLFSMRTFSGFGVGITLFNVSCLIGVLNWYIDQTKTISRAQKLEALSLLAGGIAHDFNNILCGILGNTALLKDSVDQSGGEALVEIDRAVLRARALSGQMITYARGGVQKRQTINIVKLIRELADSYFLDGDVTYRLESEKGLWPVWADPIQIGQVIQNILLNAKEAMKGRGTLTIIAENYDHRALLSSKRAGRYVSLRIRDSGPGISKEDEKKIFDPYFSTKDNGTGLGLSVCWAILENHGGTIEFVPANGGGAEFLINLPAG